MAISKIIYKSSAEDTGTVWMDVTQKTVTAGSMLNGTTALKNDGTDITGNIATKTSANLTASGATVTAPAGYYASDASKSVASGSEGTPTATKGTVSNHAVTVTPSVTNTAGYISGGTHTGTGVSVSVSELESGTKQITENGTGISVSGYSSVDVAVQGGADCPTFTVTISNDQITGISCDKTYAECAEMYNNGNSLAIVDYPSWDYKAGATVFGIENNSIIYDGDATPITNIEITYASNGSITWEETPIPYRSVSALTASNLTVTAPIGYYPYGASKTLTDNNLSAGNIKKDVSIFGVTGTYEGSGGGGLEYETGTYTPTEDVAHPTINFANSHTTAPIYFAISDTEGTYDSTTYTNHFCSFSDIYNLFGSGIYPDSSTIRYALVSYMYRGTTATSFTGVIMSVTYPPSTTYDDSSAYYGYWVSNSGIKPGSNSTSRYWRSGRTYKWIAVWAPTS